MRRKFEIEDGIPPPVRKYYRKTPSSLEEVMAKMEVGQSFLFPVPQLWNDTRVRNECILASGRWPGRAFICRKVGPDVFRVWRDV